MTDKGNSNSPNSQICKIFGNRASTSQLERLVTQIKNIIILRNKYLAEIVSTDINSKIINWNVSNNCQRNYLVMSDWSRLNYFFEVYELEQACSCSPLLIGPLFSGIPRLASSLCDPFRLPRCSSGSCVVSACPCWLIPCALAARFHFVTFQQGDRSTSRYVLL